MDVIDSNWPLSACHDDREPASHHAALVQALKARDPVAACEALHGDIKSAAEFIVNTGALVVADAIKPVDAE